MKNFIVILLLVVTVLLSCQQQNIPTAEQIQATQDSIELAEKLVLEADEERRMQEAINQALVEEVYVEEKSEVEEVEEPVTIDEIHNLRGELNDELETIRSIEARIAELEKRYYYQTAKTNH